jgi:fumarylacetoacetase
VESWLPVPDGSLFGVDNLPYGVFVPPGEERPRVGVAIGDAVLDLPAALAGEPTGVAATFAEPALNRFLAAGPAAWTATRDLLTRLLTDPAHRRTVEPALVARDHVQMRLPFQVADYVDFYAFEQHAANLGRILRPNEPPLTPNWKHLPIGYHGRAGTVVVSGTDVVRPCGQRRPPGSDAPSYGPSQRLDVEVEVGFVVGVPSALGSPVPTTAWRQHVFGAVLLNDWSARDLQAWEYRPLGPFLGKSFATSISPWLVPLAALEHALVQAPAQQPEPLDYLRPAGPGLALNLELTLNGTVIARPPFAAMYWTPAQQLAHLTANGASLRTGDLYASGTVSGDQPDEWGSLIELTRNGSAPLALPDGSVRTFLADGDTVSITGWAAAPDGRQIGFGEVAGTIRPARC